MKTLPENTRKNGYDYKLIKRTDKAAIYLQHDNGREVGYEVFKVRVNPERNMGGTVIPSAEMFPSDNAFGSWAWSVGTLERAEKRFELLNKG